MAAWIDGVLTSLEMIQWRGGIQTSLAELVERYPGRADWYEARDALPAGDGDTLVWYDRAGAVKRMRRFVGTRYGWFAIALVSLRHMPVARVLCPVPTDEDHSHLPVFCSGALSISCANGGGIDPVPCLAHRLTEPGDLARSLLFKYRATLYPPSNKTR